MVVRNANLAREEIEDAPSDVKKPRKSAKPRKDLKPFIFTGIGLIFIAAFLAFTIPTIRSQNDSPLSGQVEQRLKSIENKLEHLENIEKKISSMENQTTKLTISMMERVDRLEESMIYKMDKQKPKEARVKPSPQRTASSELEISTKPATPVKPTPAPAQVTEPKYHVVKSGENIFRIALKNNLTINQLLELNNMNSGSVIHPGQKLIVKK